MSDASEEQVAVEQPGPVEQPKAVTVLDAATACGHLPEELKPTRLKPTRTNRQTWIYRTALVLRGWSPDTQITQSDYEAVTAEILGAHAR